jgi:multidrug efflux system outer membrane protein
MRTREEGFKPLSRAAVVSLLSVAVAGCTVGPNYHAPSMPAPPAYKEAAPAPTATSTGAPAPALDAWWKVFGDSTLDDLEGQAVTANTDIKIAMTHVDQANAATRIAHSYQLPTVGVSPSVSRTREALERPNNGNTYGKAATYNDFALPINLSYEVDAWGKIRRMVESAKASEQASQDDQRFVRLSVTASVATDYYMLREADSEAHILSDTLVDLQRGYVITSNQYQHGLISELAVKQAKTILDQTRASIEALHIQRAQSEHAIAELLGRPVAGFSIAETDALGNPPTIPAGVPASMLARRPDIASVERSAAAASAQIGVAKAAYLPTLSLTGMAGYESVNPTALVNWQNTMASLGAGVTAPIFTAGRLKAGVDNAQAMYRQSVLQYEKTVLVAYQDVEDQLSSLHYLANQYSASSDALADAKSAEQIASNRYTAGLVSYLDVVYAQQTLLTNQQSVAQIQGQRLETTVGLIRALGGGW